MSNLIDANPETKTYTFRTDAWKVAFDNNEADDDWTYSVVAVKSGSPAHGYAVVVHDEDGLWLGTL